MKLLDGSEVRKKIINEVLEKMTNIDKRLGIVVIGIGDSDVNDLYVRQKEKLFTSLGVGFEYIKFSSDTDEREILKLIDKLNNDDSVDGIMVELPIMGNFDVKKILNEIDYRKDVDGLTEVNREKLSSNKECILSSTTEAILEIIKYYDITLDNKKIVVVGNGYLVGRPLGMIFKNKGLDVDVCDSKTSDLDEKIKKADIIITCVGKKNLIKGSVFKDKQIIIDVGVTVDRGVVYGDVERGELEDIDCLITPIIGGVGTVCVASLVKNLIKCYELKLMIDKKS